MALKLADYVVTEAGFASDLGFQKFCDIVCRVGRLTPSAAVLVTTVRATKSHGGMPFSELANEDLEALRRGADNLAAHVGIVKRYGIPCVVSINNFPTTRTRRCADRGAGDRRGSGDGGGELGVRPWGRGAIDRRTRW